MAYAVVASLLQTIDLILDHHQLSISPDFKGQIISIHQHTCSLRSFIEGSSARVNNWEETIREATVRAEDIIELLLSDSLSESSAGSSESEFERGKSEVRYSYDELEKVTQEIELIVSRVKGGRRIETRDGSDEELMEIVSRLVGGPSSLEIIAICGSGGMGKTNLSNNAYRHPLVKEHFDVRAGSLINREYTWGRLIQDLLFSMNAEYTSMVEDDLVQRLSQVLDRRRYLIVLDDVCSFDITERLMIMFPDYGNGSRIIFTTRSSELAKPAHHIHEMRLLDEDTTWDVLRDKIFEGDPCPFQLESIGRTIARSCGGHPLSIHVVSGILSSNQTKSAWDDVSGHIKIACEHGDKLYEILYLGYMYLPHHLRPCFLYLGMFPEDRPIHVSKLIKLWVAEGFVKESGYKSLEETGEEHVEDLVARRLVSVYERKSNGRLKIIEVHDLIRGMCLRQAHIDNLYVHLDRDYRHTPRLEVKEFIKSCRRVSNSIHCEDFLSGIYGSTIRTLFLHLHDGVMFLHLRDGNVDLRNWMENARLVRILNLLDVYYSDWSDEIFELFHLRYLAFSYKCSIPEAISNLKNLQTLIIYLQKEGGIDKLPEWIWRMPQLRHLRIISFKFPNKMEPIVVLESLQTLSRVVDFVCSMENLKMFPNLKKLVLYYTKKLRDVVEDYELHNLVYLQKLEILKLETDFSFEEEHEMCCATFPPTLKKLSLRGLQLSWKDMKTVASLPNLEVLKLRNHACVGNTWETSEGEFSRLIYLRIEGSNLENWITKSSHFPKLWWLVLVHCSSLLEVPYEMAEIPTLEQIQLDDTNHSLLLSAKRIQEDRLSLGLDPLQLRTA